MKQNQLIFTDNIELELTEPHFNGSNLTNRVLRQKRKDKDEKKKVQNDPAQPGQKQESLNRYSYYLPAYLWIQIKNFTNLDQQNLEAQINMTLAIAINMKDVPEILKQKIRDGLVLSFNKEQALKLFDEQNQFERSMKIVEDGIEMYTVRKIIKVGMQGEIILAPFEIITLILSVSMHEIEITHTDLKKMRKQLQRQQKELYRIGYQKFKHEVILEHLQKRIFKALQKNDEKKAKGYKQQAYQLKEQKKSHDYQWEKKQNGLKMKKEQLKKNKPQQQKIEEQKNLEEEQIQNLETEMREYKIEKKQFRAQWQQIQEDIQFLKSCKNIKIDFNFMNYGKENSVISYTEEGTFGSYDLAEKMLRVQFTNSDIPIKSQQTNQKIIDLRETQDNDEILEFSYAHFLIPLYKIPTVGIITIFVPLWLLGVINLGIFYQDTGLADRINSLAGLLLAFVALIPVIRQQLPPSPDITLVQVIVYFQTITTLLCFGQSLIVRETDFIFDWRTDKAFLASVIILLIQVVVVSCLIIKYLAFDLQKYNKDDDAPQQKAIDFKDGFYEEWDNEACDYHFRRSIDNRQIEPLSLINKRGKIKKEKGNDDKRINKQKKP